GHGSRYDRILLDAPCTASGIVRRHPDIAWLRRPSDVANLATQQARLLDALWPLLAPTGRLLYVVCSVFAEEGPRQAAQFVERNSDARMVPLPFAEKTALTLLPCVSQGAASAYAGSGLPTVHDGFFYALFEKA
ncbi:MAG TPA: 16S rRNA (cytosine(967)-C(5))-methyltransferase RsmB, partial [Burkholderiaceae bacterium]